MFLTPPQQLVWSFLSLHCIFNIFIRCPNQLRYALNTRGFTTSCIVSFSPPRPTRSDKHLDLHSLTRLSRFGYCLLCTTLTDITCRSTKIFLCDNLNPVLSQPLGRTYQVYRRWDALFSRWQARNHQIFAASGLRTRTKRLSKRWRHKQTALSALQMQTLWVDGWIWDGWVGATLICLCFIAICMWVRLLAVHIRTLHLASKLRWWCVEKGVWLRDGSSVGCSTRMVDMWMFWLKNVVCSVANVQEQFDLSWITTNTKTTGQQTSCCFVWIGFDRFCDKSIKRQFVEVHALTLVWPLV